ncbi:hypothetical protein [Massilia sp. NP310]|uniref:hypothetical protein n=1 Tax=Massilia sp. NP310 TaxID=2861282 RepID=UPI001C63500D|nr:hypothetical protein [Massilia sp. NP310]QYG00141.1 hypothetical protein KY496_17310 [Massilia sp. NP310]
MIDGLRHQYGEKNLEIKLQNFSDLKSKPFSVAAFHNKFLQQIRDAFVIGSYYPALTAACSLGERILNHLLLLLRDYHKDSTEYKKIYRKDSFDYWPTAIDTLESWAEILPETAELFRSLSQKRNKAIHFNPDTDHNDRQLALEAIHLLQEIVSVQFSAYSNRPWYFHVPGEIYIRKEWEDKPLIKRVFIPSSVLVGPMHQMISISPHLVINDRFQYEDELISDEKFIELRTSATSEHK